MLLNIQIACYISRSHSFNFSCSVFCENAAPPRVVNPVPAKNPARSHKRTAWLPGDTYATFKKRAERDYAEWLRSRELETPAKNTPLSAPASASTPAASSSSRSSGEVPVCTETNFVQLNRLQMLLAIHKQESQRQTLDPPCSPQVQSCPYTTGPLMQQRYNLMRRLYQVNVQLYGQYVIPSRGESSVVELYALANAII